MQKLLLLLGIFFYSTMLFGAYDVKIGVYKNGENLRHNIARVANIKYRKSIMVERKNHLYYAHAVLTNGVDAKNALHAYKRVFKDAFISKNQVRVKKVVKKVKIPEKIKHIDAQALLENKTIYLCYEKGPKHLKDRVVQMVFAKEFVTYNPLKKMATPVKMPYEFKDNNLTLHLSDMKITHHIYKASPNFLYAHSIIDGLVVNKLRYYFDEKAALEYVNNH